MRQVFQLLSGIFRQISSYAALCLCAFLFGQACLSIAYTAHAAPPIIESGLNTRVSEPLPDVDGKTQFDITGGTRVGTNLFHSFSKFSVPTDTIANFSNGISFDPRGVPLAPGLPTDNILARVTTQTPSAIFGTVQTTGFGDAHLFLINPSGIVLGPNASLNVGGSVTFTTADYLRLGGTNASPGIFQANPSRPNVLTTAPVAAFGFLESNTSSIAVQGSTLRVQPSQSLSLVGGNKGFSYTNPDSGGSASVPNGITITSGGLKAENGQINIASVASRGEISTADFMPADGMTMGNITLSQGTLVDVSANAAGMVRIRGGKLVIDTATVSANTSNTDGIGIDIYVLGKVSLKNDQSPALTATTTGTGDGGSINIRSGSLDATASFLQNGKVALIDTHTSGTGTAGDVTVTTGNFQATNKGILIDSGTAGTGHGGNVTIQGSNITLEGPKIATGNFRFAQLLGQDVSGSAGNLTMRATETLQIGPSSGISTEAWFAKSGNITLEGHDVRLIGNSSAIVDGDIGGATIKVNADRLQLDFASALQNNTVIDRGGSINISARIVELTRGSRIQTSTLGEGTAGDINVSASERLIIDGRDNPTPLPSAIVSGFFELNRDGGGGSGSIKIITPQLQLLGGGLINTSTSSSGNAGNISISAHSIAISGQRQTEVPNAVLEIGSTRGSGIYTRTVGKDLCLNSCGDAGHITIVTDVLKLDDHGTINSGTTNNGHGGDITISAKQSVTIRNRASISANSTGPGDAGNISINAGRRFEMRNGSVSTQAAHASGGNIDIRAIDQIRLRDSRISSSVQGGPGTTGGNISIDPKVVILQNSKVLAQAVRGNGGNITITTPVFIADQLSQVDASSQFGLNGTVTIQSPISNLSGTVGQLASKPSQTHVLVQSQCATLANGLQSSFIVAGRQALPVEPGGWLGSPALTAMGVSTSPEITAERPGAEQPLASGSETLSLRRLTPAGFLVRSFAVDGSTGCRS